MEDNSSKSGSFGTNVTKSFKDGTRPKFLGGKSEGGDAPSGLKAAEEKATTAAAGLKSAENSAASGELNQSEDSLAGTRQTEEEAGGLYSGGGKQSTAPGKQKGKLKSRLLKSTPMVGVFGIIVAVGGLMGGAQTLMPVAIQEMIIEKFNSVGISSTMASDSWLDTQLNQGVRMENLTTGQQENLFAFSSYQVSEFKKHGIIVVDNVGSNSTQITALLYEKNGQYIPVVGSDFIGQPNLTEAIKTASSLDNIGEPVSAKEALADPNFKTPYTAASKSWRGGSSGWFDDIMSSITQTKLGIERNRWARYVKKVANGISGEFKKIASSSKLDSAGDDGINADTVDEIETTNADGERVTEEVEAPINDVDVEGEGVKNVSDDKIKTSSVSGDNASGAIDKVNTVLSSKAIKAASAVGEYGCALLEGLMSVYTVVSAYQSLQFLNLTSGYLEAVSKVKAGDGDDSPVHEYNEELTTTGNTLDDNGNIAAENKTAMESQGMAWLFSDSKVNQSDASVRNVNFETIMSNSSKLFSNISLTADIYEKCGYVKAGVAVVDLVTTIISFVPVIGQGVKAAQLGAKAIAKAAVKATVQIALYAVIPIAAKNLAKMMIKDAATEWFGEDLGNALVSGAGKYLGGNGTSGGQSPGSEKKISEYMVKRDTVIAEEAEYQRAVKSPFDITSKYTFLGSLAYSVIPMAYSNNSVSSVLKNTSNLVSSSTVAILPTASAISEESALNGKGDCELLGSTGAMGDAFCNPYIITDVSTMGYSPVAINEIVHRIGEDDTVAANSLYNNISSNFENGKIKSSSNLAKYITYCGQRTSQYGIKDAAIYDRLMDSDNTAKKIIGYIPVLSSIKDIADGIKEEQNMAWLNGSACVASEENKYWDSEYKYYQRYAENERLLENINPGYKSTVTAFVEEQLKENPLDQSFEGQLARFSGMNKEDVEDTLALIEYYQFLDEYDPTERYAFGAPATEAKEIKFDNENRLASIPVLLDRIIYSDIRNRSFAV